MEKHQVEIILRATQPIAHSSGNEGNIGVLMRRKVCLSSGRWERVPYITGDTMRHGLREAATYALLESAGILDGAGLSEAALRLLFAGGMVSGSAHDVIRLEEQRRWAEMMPHLPLLGGCVSNRIVPGKLEVGDAWLISEETADARIVPEWVGAWMAEHGREASRARQHVELVQRVRMDPTLHPSKRLLLSGDASASAEQRLEASELASIRDDAKGKDASKSTMMPFSYETVAAGSLFWWRLDAVTHTQLERDTLYMMLAAFMAKARVGGKKGTGHGLLEPVEARGLERSSADASALDQLSVTTQARSPEIERFRAHVAERRDAIREWLAGVVA